MTKLNETDFTNLITDFYSLFAPSSVDKLPNLIEKYKNTAEDQMNAIKTAHIIYFNSKNPLFIYYKDLLPEIATERNIVQLMETYSKGDRIISKEIAEKIQKEKENKILSEINKKKQEEENSLKNDKKIIEDINNNNIKIIEELKKEVETLRNKENTIQQISSIEMEYEIISFIEATELDASGKPVYKNFDYSNVTFPDKKFIPSLSVGQRLILSCDNTIIGVEVVDINDDYTEGSSKPTRLLGLKRV